MFDSFAVWQLINLKVVEKNELGAKWRRAVHREEFELSRFQVQQDKET